MKFVKLLLAGVFRQTYKLNNNDNDDDNNNDDNNYDDTTTTTNDNSIRYGYECHGSL